MPRDHHGYQYFLRIGDLFSKYIQAASTIADALLSQWIYTHGTPYFLLSDQVSNVDGDVIKEICNVLGVEKRRSYHSQRKGFAEQIFVV